MTIVDCPSIEYSAVAVLEVSPPKVVTENENVPVGAVEVPSKPTEHTPAEQEQGDWMLAFALRFETEHAVA